jgi:nucleotide-binding universal stress UspA family protein
MKTIVALVDLTDNSTKILGHAKAMASAFGAEVILMHVVPLVPIVAVSYGNEMPAIPMDPSPEAVRADKTRLDALLATFTEAGIPARAAQFEGPVAVTLLEETEKLMPDLVIMGTHHHGTFYKLFIGSVAADVLKEMSFPVLVVPCDPPKET